MSSISERISEIINEQRTKRQVMHDETTFKKQREEERRKTLKQDCERLIAPSEPFIKQTLSEINEKYLMGQGKINKDSGVFHWSSQSFNARFDEWDITNYEEGFCAVSLKWSQTPHGTIGRPKNKLRGKDRNLVLSVAATGSSPTIHVGVLTHETGMINYIPNPKISAILSWDHLKIEKFETQKELLEIVARKFTRVFSP
jgi:hypothetical protein